MKPLLDHAKKCATFKAVNTDAGLIEPEYRMKTPLPESILRLTKMRANEIPSDEESYSKATDSFIGGDGFIRLCGEPVFMDVFVRGGNGFRYFASIGYEGNGTTVLGNDSFFLGELALYFFVSSDWKRIRVVCQSTS